MATLAPVDPDAAARTRSGALLIVVQATLGLLAAALPHPPSYETSVLCAVGTVGLLGGVAVGRQGVRVGANAWTLLVGAACALVGVATVASDGVATMALGFLPALLWAGWYLSPGAVAGLTAWVGLSYAVMLVLARPPGVDPAPHWFFTVAYLAAGATVATRARRRIAGLADDAEHAARTDALTGLGNRRRLQSDLERLLAGPERRPGLLVLYDLNGFKRYNDRFGHPAGDALLGRLGQRLQAAMGGRGTAYRLGGDEFCVLTETVDGADGLEDAGSAALTEIGDAFAVDAVHGVARLPLEADNPAAALGLADQRMYRRKHGRPSSPASQAAEALLGALRERDGDLARHNDDVAELAVRAGDHLGLRGEDLHDLARAAALHDVGKIAIPEPILHKPGPLDDDEWRFMRQHTVIGERILSAAPALHGVARLVRASHERFDGGGYPDGLAGPAVPLGARILAVCDSFDAITSDRPYRPARSAEEAVAELRRCAGSQFDPACVEALVRCLPVAAEPALA